MGITIVQNSDLKKRRGAKKALILAGGAVTGGSFMAGGVKALNDYLENFSVSDFDIYVGISAGSLLAASLVGGLSPEEMLKSLDGTSRRFSQLSPFHVYWPNWKELISRPVNFWYSLIANVPRLALDFLKGMRKGYPRLAKELRLFLKRPSEGRYRRLLSAITKELAFETFPSWLELLPSGIFDNSPLERYLRANIERNHLTNNFKVTERLTGKKLYISAMSLDGAKRVVFGPDERNDVTISQAVQASTALPGFYKPARIGGVDYVDGGVWETANIDIAIDKGASLIICYNPFRPFDNKVFLEYIKRENKYVSSDHRLSDDGVMAVLNQIFRAFFHTRLHVVLDQYKKMKTFKGDIILIEPEAGDAAFFELNPLLLGNRIKAAALGYQSVVRSIGKNFDVVKKILSAYGIRISRKKVDVEIERMDAAQGDSRLLREMMEGRRRV